MNSPRAKLQKTDYGYLLEFRDDLDISINELHNTELTKMKVRAYVEVNDIIVENLNDYDFLGESYSFDGLEPINEMDLFDVERRDLTTIKQMLKASENASKLIPSKKNYTGNRMKCAVREIVRDGLHQLEQFDSLYNAIGILKSQPVKKPKKTKK